MWNSCARLIVVVQNVLMEHVWSIKRLNSATRITGLGKSVSVSHKTQLDTSNT